MKTIRIVCFEFGVDVDDLFKSKLSNNASLARKIIIYLLYERFNADEIRLKLGLSNNQKVYIALQWVRDKISINSELKEKVRRLKSEINEH